jgi:hypothetical protein
MPSFPRALNYMEKTLEPDDDLQEFFRPTDEVQNIFEASHNNQHGYVLLTKKKLLFVREKGFLKRSYNLDLDVPYNIVDELRCIGHMLTFLVREKRYSFKSGSAGTMEHSLRTLKT